MTRNDIRSRQSIGIKLCIWSIRNQAWLAGHVRLYIYTATALVAFLALAGVISFETAMFSAFSGGTVLMGLIWTLVQQRRAMLLNIQDPEVREQAHSAMLSYLRQVDPDLSLCVRADAHSGTRQEECRECASP